jgi:hypothetical protein
MMTSQRNQESGLLGDIRLRGQLSLHSLSLSAALKAECWTKWITVPLKCDISNVLGGGGGVR